MQNVPNRYLRGKHAPLVLSLTYARRKDLQRWLREAWEAAA